MSGMEYGTDEHLDGLSRDALKSEVRWWYGRALEMEAENEKLRDAARLMWQRLRWADETMGCGVLDKRFERRMRELGVEV